MHRKIVRTIALGSFALVVVLNTAWQAQAQDCGCPTFRFFCEKWVMGIISDFKFQIKRALEFRL